MNKRELEKEAIRTAEIMIHDNAQTYVVGAWNSDEGEMTPEQDYILKVLNNLKIQIRRK